MDRRPRDRSGFTLVEILVVLGIVGIGLALAAPAFNSSMQRARFERATTELQSDLRLALSTAKATGRAVLLDFDAGGYRLVDATDSTRVYRNREFGPGVRMLASGSPLVFPWGMVQPAQVSVVTSHRDGEFLILPTGRLEPSGSTP
jgi:type II secretion system protein H